MKTDMRKIEVLRAEEEWQRAGAYYVRIHGMNRQHSISLREEFDNHDGEGTRYIVLLDNGYPVATCRFYELDTEKVILGRVVVLPEYRNQHFGQRVVREAEQWIKELGYRTVEIESRTVAVEFYRKLGYTTLDKAVVKSGVFDCVRMVKKLSFKSNTMTNIGGHMRIRHATINDLETLSKIESESYPQAEGASKESIKSRLGYFGDCFWLLDDNGEILAFINGMATNEADLTDKMYDHPEMHNTNGDWLMIFSVVTASEHRHRGYAGKVMEQVISDTKAADRKGIVLTCKEHLLPFYAKFGFVNEGLSKSTHGNAVWYQMRRVFLDYGDI